MYVKQQQKWARAIVTKTKDGKTLSMIKKKSLKHSNDGLLHLYINIPINFQAKSMKNDQNYNYIF